MKSAAFDHWAAKARAVKIEAVLERRNIKLRGGVERCGPCPKCGGEDRFSVNISKQVWNCRGCDKGGDVVGLVEHLDGCDFIVACTTLTGEPLPKPNGKDRGTAPKKVTAATFEYSDESGAIAYVVERIEYRKADGTFILTKDGKRKKTFSQRRPDPDRPGEWLWDVEGVTRVPYNLPALIEAVAMERVVYVVEGEGKVNALAELGVVATCNAGGAGKWEAGFSSYLRGASVVLVPDNDEPGFRHINDVGTSLVGIAARTYVLILPELGPKGDIKDWIAAGGRREQLDALVEAAPDWAPPPEEAPPTDENKAKAAADEQSLIDELARLDAVDYDRRRNEAAGQMGIRRGTLDNQVNARRAQRAEEEGPPPLFGHWVVEPWAQTVDTGELLLALAGRVKRHVILSDDEALTVALWIMFAWVHDAAAVHSPILLATSAEANSGKTQLLSLLGFLVPRALVCVEISEATLFRGIEKWQPTIIVDEADVILINNEPLRSVVNSGWTRGSCVPRCIGDDNTPHAFPTFCPKAIGMKGRKLPDTTLTRSIIIAMKRKKTSETVVHFRSIDDAGLVELRRRALRWANDNGEKLDGAEPDMPPGFDNRLGDNWALLLAIAAHAGGEWPTKARRAAIKLSKVDDVTSIGVQALAAIKVAFDGQQEGFEEDYTHLEPLERISSADLAATLGADMTGPWAEWKNGKPITQAQLARVLKPHGIAPVKIRLPGGGTLQGYMRSQFEDEWERYL
jgi:Protein of unknown function (DUF3631)/CHC2 zinc finger